MANEFEKYITKANDHEKYLTISLNEYLYLFEAERNLTLILKSLYENASLSYSKKKLHFDSVILSDLLKLIDGHCYANKVEELKEAENEKSDQSEE